MSERDCKECGEYEWNRFYESDNGNRTEERFECVNCGKEGRKFTHSNSVVWSGGLRA